jgi:hypothetical protein
MGRRRRHGHPGGEPTGGGGSTPPLLPRVEEEDKVSFTSEWCGTAGDKFFFGALKWWVFFRALKWWVPPSASPFLRMRRELLLRNLKI